MRGADNSGGLSPQVPLKARIGFGVGDFGFLLVWQGTTMFLMYFYTDVLGIAPATAGMIYLIAMIWDAVTDPVFAALADRTRSRMGMYRPWLLFGAIPFGLAYPLAFSGPGLLPVGPVVWALATHIVLRTAYTVVSMPFNSLQARLTNDGDERAVLAGFRMVGAATGGLAVVFLTPVLVESFGAGREQQAYFAAAGISGFLASAALLYCFFSMKEPAARPARTESLMADLKSIVPMFIANPPLMRVFAIIVTGSICLGMFSKNVLYHFKYDIQRPDLTAMALVLPAALLLITVPLWVAVAKRSSKRFSLSVGTALSLVGYLLFFFNSDNWLWLTFGSILIIGIGSSSMAVMFWAMLPDTVEYGEVATGVRAEAKTFGFATFAQKAAVGINAIVLGVLLGMVGFEANTVQTNETLLGMRAIMALVPAFGALLILIILKGYDLDKARHKELLNELERRKSSSVPQR